MYSESFLCSIYSLCRIITIFSDVICHVDVCCVCKMYSVTIKSLLLIGCLLSRSNARSTSSVHTISAQWRSV